MHEQELLSGIRQGLKRAGVHEDDMEWMAAMIARELDGRFRMVPDIHRGQASFVEDLEVVMSEVFAREALEEMSEEERQRWAAEYITARLGDKWQFSVRLSWYIEQGRSRVQRFESCE